MRQPAPISLRELEIRAVALCGHSIAEIARGLEIPLPALPIGLRHAKGFIGQLIEAALGAQGGSSDAPDFPHLGVELKTIPVGRSGRPIESTFVCSIAMARAEHERWETSRLRRRLARVLWVPIATTGAGQPGERRLGRPVLWEPTPAQQAIVRADWEDLMGTIGSGGASALTAHRGHALQVRPKARSAKERTLGAGVDGPDVVRPLGFYLRAAFTHAILDGRAWPPALENTWRGEMVEHG